MRLGYNVMVIMSGGGGKGKAGMRGGGEDFEN